MHPFEFLQDIRQYAEWVKIEPINKGWSQDKKFCIERQDGARLLLRLSSHEQYPTKQKEFAAMHQFRSIGIRMSEPLELGICGRGDYVYMLLTWQEGDTLGDVFGTLSEQKQFEIGIKAGEILRTIHSIPAPVDQPDWQERMTKKIKSHLERYHASEFKVPSDELALKYIEENLHLLKKCPQVLQHGDYHPGNMILSPTGELSIIDFNRWDYGDPYEEFNRMMVFSREQSIPFARGQLVGYFGEDIPDLFFRLVALYLADVILFSVVWATSFGQADVDNMLRRAQMILDDYDGFTTHKPIWL